MHRALLPSIHTVLLDAPASGPCLSVSSVLGACMAFIQLSCQSVTIFLTREKEQDKRNRCVCVCILCMVDHGSIKATRNLQANTRHPHHTSSYIQVFVIDFCSDMIHVFLFTCQILCSQPPHRSNKRTSQIHSCYLPPASEHKCNGPFLLKLQRRKAT